MTAPTREEHADAREELARLQQSYEARLRSLATKVRATQEDVRDDLVLEQMGRDPCSAAYVQERLGEVLEAALASEQEAQIGRLCRQLAAREAALLQLQGTHEATCRRMAEQSARVTT